MTSEGKVKREITKILDRWKTVVPMHVWMPVPNGYGKSGLDYHCIVAGHALIIEAKAPGKEPTPRQRDALKGHLEAGATCFIISEQAGLDALDQWFQRGGPMPPLIIVQGDDATSFEYVDPWKHCMLIRLTPTETK